jgi:hypothetical protein
MDSLAISYIAASKIDKTRQNMMQLNEAKLCDAFGSKIHIIALKLMASIKKYPLSKVFSQITPI